LHLFISKYIYNLDLLIAQAKNCTLCKSHLPNHPKPVFTVSEHSRILIIGQAPGQKVQESGVPWADQSGNELRRWLGVSEEQFYNAELFALMPMGFCYPGSSKSGDLPPRPECAPQWHQFFIAKMKNIRLTLLIGQYAHKYYLGNSIQSTLTQTVKDYASFLPLYLPLVHPSPRNRIWQKKNPWFEADVIPFLRRAVESALYNTKE
jgi:uracil-DNA glycosylase